MDSRKEQQDMKTVALALALVEELHKQSGANPLMAMQAAGMAAMHMVAVVGLTKTDQSKFFKAMREFLADLEQNVNYLEEMQAASNEMGDPPTKAVH